MKLDPECQVFLDVNSAGYMYADKDTEGDKGRAVRQVPHDQLMSNIFDGEGDAADLLQLSAQMEMNEITCIRIAGDRTTRQNHHMGCYWSARVGSECAQGQPQRATT